MRLLYIQLYGLHIVQRELYLFDKNTFFDKKFTESELAVAITLNSLWVIL